MNKLLLLTQAIKSCHYQQDLSFESIARYIDTFDYLMSNEITKPNIYQAGWMISRKNTGWRRFPAVIHNQVVPVPPNTIDYAIGHLVAHMENATPEQFFIRFETIHPYKDGNGRVGEILYYKLSGSFDVPKFNRVSLQWD